MAEYACPVWERSAYAHKVDPVLSDACRAITGCLQPTNVENLYLLAGIAPPAVRRSVTALRERQKQVNDNRHPLHGHNAPRKRLESRNSFIHATDELIQSTSTRRLEQWSQHLHSVPHRLPQTPSECLASGASGTWTEWRCLNRLRTKMERCKHNLRKWKYTDEDGTIVKKLIRRWSISSSARCCDRHALLMISWFTTMSQKNVSDNGSDWCSDTTRKRLPFNIDKCSILHYGKHNNMYNYCLNNYRINVDSFIKDLGVTFQDDLKFGENIKKMVLNANSKLGIIRNTFHNLSKENYIVLYKSDNTEQDFHGQLRKVIADAKRQLWISLTNTRKQHIFYRTFNQIMISCMSLEDLMFHDRWSNLQTCLFSRKILNSIFEIDLSGDIHESSVPIFSIL